jgi:hypothetical protein
LLPYTGEVCLTKVAGNHGADAFLPELDGFDLLEQEAGEDCLFEHYVRENCYR